jgi:hypothetical protein
MTRRAVLTAIVVLEVSCVAAGEDGGRERGVIREAIGAGCASDADCAATLHCASEGACLCRPGFLACGDRCYRVENDPYHCGTCNTVCAPGDACTHGACADASSGRRPRDPSFTTPIEIDGASAGSNFRVAIEGYPQSSWNNPAPLYMPFQFVSGGGSSVFNYTTPLVWTSHWLTIPPVTPGYGSNGDSWATSSGYSGYEYMSQIGNVSPAGNSCIGIGATRSVNLGGTWDYFLRCGTTPLPVVCTDNCIADGPSIHFDAGGSALFAVDTDHQPTSTNYVLHAWPNCTSSPGYAGCAEGVYSPATIYVSAAGDGHATVAVNPSTHHAVVAFRTASHGIYLAFYDGNGAPVGLPTAIFSGATFGPTDACFTYFGHVPKCTGPSSLDCGTQGCITLANKVHVATRYRAADGQSYAYITYDMLENVGGVNHMRAHLDVWNITNDVLTLKNRYSSTATDGTTDDDYGSIAAANYFNDGVVWFYYHQNGGNACNTTFRAHRSTNSATSATLPFSPPVDLTSNFPTMRFGFGGTGRLDGMGHYIGIDKRGLPGATGPIQASWAQPVRTTDTAGTACQGSTIKYSLAIYGSQVPACLGDDEACTLSNQCCGAYCYGGLCCSRAHPNAPCSSDADCCSNSCDVEYGICNY